MARIFIATNLPEEIKRELAKLREEIKNKFPDETGEYVAKWVRPDNLHITLAFLGEIGQGSVEKLKGLVEKIVNDWRAFEVKIKKVCYDSEKARIPRLIWLELARNKDLECLSDVLKKQVIEQGIVKVIDERPFVGHITLGRIREWQFKKINPEEAPEINQELGISFPAKSIDIMQSKLSRGGAVYTLIQSIPLSNV